jgi:hypothetical protein
MPPPNSGGRGMAALAVIGKEIEQIPADHFVTAAHDDLFIPD